MAKRWGRAERRRKLAISNKGKSEEEEGMKGGRKKNELGKRRGSEFFHALLRDGTKDSMLI
jgi:hypothetical protein